MAVIKFNNDNCAYCYKCFRQCDVKAIRIKDGKAQIMGERCIFCGHCMEICPQHAKTYDSDVEYVKKMLKDGETIVISLDPSYRGLMNYSDPWQIVGAFIQLGFSEVRETAEAADMVTREYMRLIEEGKMKNIVTTNCPAVVYLAEKHYPEAVEYLAPVISPMVAHGRMIKETMGKDIKVVYVGPCVSKKMEAEYDPRTRGAVDAVIELNEMQRWFDEEGIVFENCDPIPFSNLDPMINQAYPVPNGILRAVAAYGGSGDYIPMSIHSIRDCREFFHGIKRGYISNAFVEMSLCNGGCVNGPGVDKRRGFRFKSAMSIEKSVLNKRPNSYYDLPEGQMANSFKACKKVEKEPTDEELKVIMKSIGKHNSKTEFNCGACGYATCREEAIAIYQGKVEASMCSVRAYETAKSQANLVLETTPNMIFVFDENLKIMEFNRRAEEVFKVDRLTALKSYLYEVMDSKDYEDVVRTQQWMRRVKRRWDNRNMVVLMTVVPSMIKGRYLAIVEDVTEEEKRAEQELERKLRFIGVAQSVIDKQMTTAQEIAGLLGETTAETKAILTKVRDSILEEENLV